MLKTIYDQITMGEPTAICIVNSENVKVWIVPQEGQVLTVAATFSNGKLESLNFS